MTSRGGSGRLRWWTPSTDNCSLPRGNARATYAELARVVSLSAPAAHERVAKLEAAGVITGYYAAVAPESLGYAMNALIGIFINDSADIDELAQGLAAVSAVEHCWFVAGEETFVVKVRVPDGAGLEGAICSLNAIKGVARTRTTVVLSTKFEDRFQDVDAAGDQPRQATVNAPSDPTTALSDVLPR